MKSLARTFYRRFIQPVSTNPEAERREYLFNILIALVAIGAFIATISSGLTHLLGVNAHDTNSLPVTLGFMVVTLGLWSMSRAGKYKIGSLALTSLLYAAFLQLAIAWSIDLPMSQMLSILVIIIAGILISSRAVIVMTFMVSTATVILGYLQVNGMITGDTSWLTSKLEFSDAIGLAVIYLLVGAVAWLANTEIDNLLRRAWRSERALQKERDELEITVARRTQELKDIQLARMLELQKFAEFGKISAGLIHDVATPLTAASMSLEQLGDTNRKELLQDSLASLRHIERYIDTARKQLRGKSRRVKFLPSRVADEVVHLLKHQARSEGVEINLMVKDEVSIYGDPIIFHRIVANLVLNAIEAYRDAKKRKPTIGIVISRQDNMVVLRVEDNGTGISKTVLPHIFEEFYSTKQDSSRSLGLGLASVKSALEHNFNGVITAKSTMASGTSFTLEIPVHESENTAKHTKRP